MIREARESEYPLLRNFLRTKLPASMALYAILEMEEEYKIPKQIFVEDSDPTLFVFVPRIIYAPLSFSVYWDVERVSKDDLKKYLTSIPNWSWNQKFMVCSADLDLAMQLDAMLLEKELSSVSLKRGPSVPCSMFEQSTEYLSTPQLPDGFKFGHLRPHHVPYIFSKWKYSEEENIEEYQQLLNVLPTSAVYLEGDTENDNPVAWTLLYNHGFIGMTYTHPQYRRLGLGAAVQSHLCRNMSNKCPKVVQTELHNEAAVAMHSKIGFKHIGQLIWNEYYADS